jgi:hypothetical protein
LPSFTLFSCSHPTPRLGLFYLSVLHFFKCILIVQGGFTLVFQTCLCLTLIRLSPHYLLFFTLLPYYSTAYSALCYIIFIHRCDVSILFILLIFSFLHSFPCCPLYSLCLSLSHTHIYMYLCVHLSNRSSFHT